MRGKLSIYMTKIAYSTKFFLVFTHATTLKLIVIKDLSLPTKHVTVGCNQLRSHKTPVSQAYFFHSHKEVMQNTASTINSHKVEWAYIRHNLTHGRA
jgi:hypothetical protein